MSDYNKYSAEIPDKQLIERLLSVRPDAKQLFAFLSRSYDYIKKLPLKGISENYSKVNSDLSDVIL